MKHYIEEQVSKGGYSSAGEYVRELVRADQKRCTKEQLEQVNREPLSGADQHPSVTSARKIKKHCLISRSPCRTCYDRDIDAILDA
jgi:antitoxin ParD1/3/4